MATDLNYTATEFYVEGLETFSTKALPLDKFSTKFELGEVKGSTISVPLFDASSQEWNAANGYRPSGSIEEVSVPVTLIHTTNAVDVGQASSNPAAYLPSFYAKALKEHSGKIAEKALADITSFTQKVGVPSASFGYNIVGSGQGYLDGQNSNGSRIVLTKGLWNSALSPKTTDNLSLSVMDYEFEGKYRAPLPATVGSAMIDAGAYAIAAGYPSDPLRGTSALIAERDIVTDEGIPVHHKIFADAVGGKLYSTFQTVIGGKVALANGGYLVTGVA
jgi:hypothetical protein